MAIDPRLATKTELTKNVRALAALGIAHQPPSFVVPCRAFSQGPAAVSDGVPGGSGVEVDLLKSVTATLTLYHNAFDNMRRPARRSTARGQRLRAGHVPHRLDRRRSRHRRGRRRRQHVRRAALHPHRIGPDRSGGGGQGADSAGAQRTANAFEVRTKGEAYGLELFVKKKLTDRIGGFLSYTLSRSTRTFDSRTYIASFDRTHVLNTTALAFDLGRNWRAGSRFTFYTGLPKAPDPRATPRVSTRSIASTSASRSDGTSGKTWWISFVAEWMNVTLHRAGLDHVHPLGMYGTESGPLRSRASGPKVDSDGSSSSRDTDASPRRVVQRRQRRDARARASAVRRLSARTASPSKAVPRDGEARVQPHVPGQTRRDVRPRDHLPARRHGTRHPAALVERDPGRDRGGHHYVLAECKYLENDDAKDNCYEITLTGTLSAEGHARGATVVDVRRAS